MKRPLSLLEVVIALGLTAILLTTLFSCYRHLVLSKAKVDTVRNELYPKLFTQARLIQVFDNLEEGHSFYTDEGVLNFHFDNGLDRDPKFCGPIDGKLFADNKQLILKLNDDRIEVLQTKISDLSFAFFDLKKNEWLSEWRGTLLPAQVRICVGEDVTTYSIPNMLHEVTYK